MIEDIGKNDCSERLQIKKMQVSTHDQDTPAANKQHKIEDQLPEYFNHGRILAPLAYAQCTNRSFPHTQIKKSKFRVHLSMNERISSRFF